MQEWKGLTAGALVVLVSLYLGVWIKRHRSKTAEPPLQKGVIGSAQLDASVPKQAWIWNNPDDRGSL